MTLPPESARKGLIVAIATLVALIPSSASVGFCAQGYVVEPITAEFGWTRTEFMSAVSGSIVVLALLYPLVGYWGDRYGVRPVLLILVTLFGLGTQLFPARDREIPQGFSAEPRSRLQAEHDLQRRGQGHPLCHVGAAS